MKRLLPFLLLLCAFNTQKVAAQPGRWYSYYEYLDYMTGSAVGVTTMNIWNDTTSIQHGYSSSSGHYYYNEKFTSIGMSFAPRLNAWNATWMIPSATIKVGPMDVFTIDSVKLHGQYFRNLSKPASLKDTLRLAFVHGDGTAISNLPSASISTSYAGVVNYVSLFYDSVDIKAGKNTTGALPYTEDILLSNTDTATAFERSYVLTTPFTVPAGEFASMSLTFKTGDPTWTTNDTVTYLTGGHKFGSFHPYVMFNSPSAGTVGWPYPFTADSNAGYFKRPVAASLGWNPYYLPTWAWNDGAGAPSVLQYPVVDFHINCVTCRLAEDIFGSYLLCPGATETYTHGSPGGTWSSSNPAVATVSSSGLVTAVTGGTAHITYALGTNYATHLVSVNSVTAVITGPSAVCVGNTITLTGGPFTGTWSSSATSIATISPTGEVTGLAPGTTTINYAIWNVCGTVYGAYNVTVETLPDAGTLTGADTICLNSSAAIATSVTGGTWSTSNSNVSVTGGTVSGVAAGLSTITYTVTNMCGSSDVQKLVNVIVCPTGVGNVSNEANISVAPNPTNDEINISSATKINSLVIYDVAGQKVFSGSYNSRNVNVSMREMPAGIYTIRVNNYKTYRVVRQ